MEKEIEVKFFWEYPEFNYYHRKAAGMCAGSSHYPIIPFSDKEKKLLRIVMQSELIR